MAHVSPSLNCLSSNGMGVAVFRLFIIVFFFDDKQGISLTTWMVVGETDKWNTNFKFFCHFFDVVRHVEWELFQNGILLFWRKQISPFVLIVFFFFLVVHLFLWQRFISAQRTCCCRPSLMRCHKNRDVRSSGRD